MRNHRINAFTLMELLVVVGIISILGSIALQNYTDASTRAKVSRCLADFRAIAVAIESYSVDHGRVPRMAHATFYNDVGLDYLDGKKVNGLLCPVITTPIAYLSAMPSADPFMASNSGAPPDERNYTYQDILAYREKRATSPFWQEAQLYYGAWRLGSVGPDMQFDHNFTNSAQLPYDPTNGVVSLGNLWYSPRGWQEGLPPVPELLGAH